MRTSGVRIPWDRKTLVPVFLTVAAILAIYGGVGGASGQTGSAKASQQQGVVIPAQLGEEPIYGTEYVRPTPEEIAQIKDPADDPFIQFEQRYHRMVKIDATGAQVGYVDSRDTVKLTSDDSLIDVKDKDGNIVGVTGPSVIFQAVER